MKKEYFRKNSFIILVVSLFGLITSCTTENEIDSNLLKGNAQNASIGDYVDIDNPGFEDGKDDWDGSFAISEDTNSGSYSGKLSSSSKSFSQTVSVSSNTDYTLSAYILGSGTIGATVNGSDNEVSDNYDDSNWTKVSVEFNSGSSNSITIYANYYSDEGRFDDFELIEGSGEVESTSGYTNVPAKIEAEDYSGATDGRTETTSDDGGGSNVGWIDDGEYLTYNINTTNAGAYTFDFRVASRNQDISFDIYADDSVIGSVSESSTGGWQTWTTTSVNLNLPSGNITLKLVATGGGWNINWFEVSTEEEIDIPVTGSDVEDVIGDFWKITLPVDEDGNGSPSNCSDYDCRNNDAVDLYNLNDVASNSDYNDYFYESNGWVVFTAFCGGATTENSQYPRTELRGLDDSGDDSYFDLDDYQELEVTVKVLEVPVQRPEVNMVQIHAPSSEPLRVEFNDGSQGFQGFGQGLHITYNENNIYNDVIDYEIGQELKVKVVVEDGNIEIWLNNLSNGDSYNANWDAEDSTGYWKVGCYLQGSISYCDVKASESFCSNGGESDDYYTTGSVAVKDLTLIRDGETYK